MRTEQEPGRPRGCVRLVVLKVVFFFFTLQMFPSARCVGARETRPSYWLFGLLLTEGGTGEEQAAIVLRNDSGVAACLPSSEVSA